MWQAGAGVLEKDSDQNDRFSLGCARTFQGVFKSAQTSKQDEECCQTVSVLV